MSPDRRTIVWWAIGTVVVLSIPMLILIGFAVSTKGNTDDIKAAQTEAEEATAAAERNGAVSACQSEYARTEQGWLARFTRAAAARDLEAADTASRNEEEMNRRALGVVALARQDAGQPFHCPPIPERLMIEPLDPLNPDPPAL